MAESQEIIVYDPALVSSLDAAISPARLAPYVGAAKGDRQFALALYLWNARLSKAFLFPLQMAEVTTRNAMHSAFSAEFGSPSWVHNPPFQLTPESAASHQRALVRLSATPASDEVVAALSFDFWSNLFRREYQQLWAMPGLLAATFPHLPPPEDRRDVQRRVAEINRLRNRIAHHEPIHQNFNHKEIHDTILDLIGLRCADTRRWTRQNSTVMAIVRSPPNPATIVPGRPLASANLRPPPLLDEATTLSTAMKVVMVARPPVAIIKDSSSGAVAVLTNARVLQYINTQCEADGGLIDLSEHTLGQVLAKTEPIKYEYAQLAASTGDVMALFFKPNTAQIDRPQFVIVVHEDRPMGVITRPDVRF